MLQDVMAVLKTLPNIRPTIDLGAQCENLTKKSQFSLKEARAVICPANGTQKTWMQAVRPLLDAGQFRSKRALQETRGLLVAESHGRVACGPQRNKGSNRRKTATPQAELVDIPTHLRLRARPDGKCLAV